MLQFIEKTKFLYLEGELQIGLFDVANILMNKYASTNIVRERKFQMKT